MPNRFTIIRDTREQQGYFFDEDPLYCGGTEIAALKTGDYSIRGHENVICVERKKSTGELAGNLGESRFARELERMTKIKHRFLVCEFPYSNIMEFPANSGIPRSKFSKLRITSKYMLRRLVEMQMTGINVIFCEDSVNARHYVWYLMKRVFEEICDA